MVRLRDNALVITGRGALMDYIADEATGNTETED